jgi:hypothetical protein
VVNKIPLLFDNRKDIKMDKLKKIVNELQIIGSANKYGLSLYDIGELITIYEELEEKAESKTIIESCIPILKKCKLKIKKEGIGWIIGI